MAEMDLEYLNGTQSKVGKLSGVISVEDNCLSGTITPTGSLSGKLDLHPTYGEYTGEYVVTPKAFKLQTLPTTDKVLKQDVTVLEIPYMEVHNVTGTTVTIGGIL